MTPLDLAVNQLIWALQKQGKTTRQIKRHMKKKYNITIKEEKNEEK
jgi:hypothetical protein